ncbi:hypothetical protein [Verminephrobacter aporrectodeae]|uniref:hypothetical protein n=1 Tax=Verminephrobacter aporrectodeae TaxID=1110389 RepID=UPI002242DA0C|nr:hypothetical protein [Verminephrobacter aporrectodeae]
MAHAKQHSLLRRGALKNEGRHHAQLSSFVKQQCRDVLHRSLVDMIQVHGRQGNGLDWHMGFLFLGIACNAPSMTVSPFKRKESALPLQPARRRNS